MPISHIMSTKVHPMNHVRSECAPHPPHPNDLTKAAWRQRFKATSATPLRPCHISMMANKASGRAVMWPIGNTEQFGVRGVARV